MHHANNQGNTFLVLAETGIILIAAYACHLFLLEPQDLNPFDFHPSFFFNISALTLSFLLASLSVGLYNSKLRESFRSIVRRVFVSLAMTYLGVGLILYNLFPEMEHAKDFLPLTLAAILVLTIAVRYTVHSNEGLNALRKKILILGAGERASIVEKRMRRKVDQNGFDMLGFVPMPGDRTEFWLNEERRLDLDLKNLLEYVEQNDVNSIVIACDERRNVLPLETLFECKIRGVNIVDVLDFVEQETGQVAVTLIYPSWVIYSNGFESSNYIRVTLDYAFNVGLASIVLFLTWPFMLLTALAIWLDDGRRTGASVFYTQERVGLDGIPFKIYKFRSMRPDAEQHGAKWAQKNDSRVTRLGNVMRKYRIDELPQLINVFRGEMGFVGPRPERPEFVLELVKSIPYYNQRHNVKPGLTGWAQLRYPYGASQEDSLEKLKYDLYYIKHRSILLDLFILLRTVEIVLFGKGR